MKVGDRAKELIGDQLDDVGREHPAGRWTLLSGCCQRRAGRLGGRLHESYRISFHLYDRGDVRLHRLCHQVEVQRKSVVFQTEKT